MNQSLAEGQIRIVLLVIPKMLPYPKGVVEIQNFGDESIQDYKNGEVTHGKSVMIQGSVSDIRPWLHLHSPVWGNLNLIADSWNLMEIPNEQSETVK